MAKRKPKKLKYNLYALKLTPENIKLVEDSRFYRITSTYILLYEHNQRFTNYNRIGDDELHYLSYADRRWLLDCNMAIIAEETEKHKDEIATDMNLMVDRLEEALKAEKAKEENGENRQS